MKISAAIWGGCAVILTVAACASRKPPSGENYYVQATQEYSQHFDQLAQEQIVICREMLSRHEYLVGNFYFKRANFKAAESRMAELVASYQDTPMAPEGLYDLGQTLEKQGKKYSAAQAFAALKLH